MINTLICKFQLWLFRRSYRTLTMLHDNPPMMEKLKWTDLDRKKIAELRSIRLQQIRYLEHALRD